ncbi:membrane protein insertase YidC [Candidatus Pantoea edessiphila]|uniref:Membrane protein insertase YidC n=1 Tax=Candidatus Pantoea edessiphila TaxID=2044610 RepID=A0A2P5SVD6_9GAMM|nr:membrane protein insertase YidC [Candidatus Pantoea edessiphila]PPI86288.1 membrane protein insertase YidC [Candidatus Pantoea edessiphila]
MDSQRNLFLIVFLVLFIILWQTWQTDHNLQLFNDQQINNENTSNNSKINIDEDKNILINKKDQNIFVKTDVLSLKISNYGGDIYQAELLAFPEKIGSHKPTKILETNKDFLYQIQTGLNGIDGPDNIDKQIRPMFITKKQYFKMSKDKNILEVSMSYKNKFGVIYDKIFTFKRGEYFINIRYKIHNFTKKYIRLSVFGQLKQTLELPKYKQANNNFALHTFRGAAYSTDDIKYKKYKFDNIVENENLNVKTKTGWIAMLQQYFVTALILNTTGNLNTIYTNNINNNTVAIGFQSEELVIPPGTTKDIASTVWLGPELQDKMALVAPNLDLTVDYGWLWFIAKPLFKLLKFIYSFVNNWGFSIIIITFIVRGLMYPLTKAQYISMAKMRMIQPKIQIIRERFDNDKQKMGQAMMNLYKEEKVNPLGGCLPILIQMPIFLALYYMLSNSVELRQAPFIFWIHDLSTQDPYYVLPILMGGTMWFIQKMSPINVSDPLQQKVMMYMPIIFTIFFLWFPSGLVIYYIISNLVTILQQQMIYRSLKKYGIL